jgi:hypothetical protein
MLIVQNLDDPAWKVPLGSTAVQRFKKVVGVLPKNADARTVVCSCANYLDASRSLEDRYAGVRANIPAMFVGSAVGSRGSGAGSGTVAPSRPQIRYRFATTAG